MHLPATRHLQAWPPLLWLLPSISPEAAGGAAAAAAARARPVRGSLVGGGVEAAVAALAAAEGSVDPADAAFEVWREHHRKVYRSPEAEAAGRAAFVANHRHIEAHNKRTPRPAYELGHNAFSDLTWDEFAATHLPPLSPTPQPTPPQPTSALPGASVGLLAERRGATGALPPGLPPMVDWRQAGVVSRVRDQGKCGACWSFAAVGAMEAMWAITTGILEVLSAEQLVDCDLLDRGCDGGNPANAFLWAEQHPVCAEADWPYAADNGERGACAMPCHPRLSVSARGGEVPQADEDALLAAIARQPVSVSLAAGTGFQLYKAGVFDDAAGCAETLNHAALAVGYGNAAAGGARTAQPYYLLKNSWGGTWGEQGYMRLARGANLCAVASAAAYPVNVSRVLRLTHPLPPAPPLPPPLSPSLPPPLGEEDATLVLAVGWLSLLAFCACTCALTGAALAPPPIRPPPLALAACAASAAGSLVRAGLMLPTILGYRPVWPPTGDSSAACVGRAVLLGVLDNAAAAWLVTLIVATAARGSAGPPPAANVALLTIGMTLACAPLALLGPAAAASAGAGIHACALVPVPALGSIDACVRGGPEGDCRLGAALFAAIPACAVAIMALALFVHDCLAGHPLGLPPRSSTALAHPAGGVLRACVWFVGGSWGMAILLRMLLPLHVAALDRESEHFVLVFTTTFAYSAAGLFLGILLGSCWCCDAFRRVKQQRRRRQVTGEELLQEDMLIRAPQLAEHLLDCESSSSCIQERVPVTPA